MQVTQASLRVTMPRIKVSRKGQPNPGRTTRGPGPSGMTIWVTRQAKSHGSGGACRGQRDIKWAVEEVVVDTRCDRDDRAGMVTLTSVPSLSSQSCLYVCSELWVHTRIQQLCVLPSPPPHGTRVSCRGAASLTSQPASQDRKALPHLREGRTVVPR